MVSEPPTTPFSKACLEAYEQIISGIDGPVYPDGATQKASLELAIRMVAYDLTVKSAASNGFDCHFHIDSGSLGQTAISTMCLAKVYVSSMVALTRTETPNLDAKDIVFQTQTLFTKLGQFEQDAVQKSVDDANLFFKSLAQTPEGMEFIGLVVKGMEAYLKTPGHRQKIGDGLAQLSALLLRSVEQQ